MGLGKKIAYYQKNKNITQDELAKQLGISNQAVSKWETGQSCPDVELLPRLADIFEITLDELFDRDFIPREEAIEEAIDAESVSTVSEPQEFPNKVSVSELKVKEEWVLVGTRPEVLNAPVLYTDSSGLPWADDETLHVALYVGHQLIRGEELKKRFGRVCKDISFNYNGPALNVESSFSVVCSEVQGNVTAGSYVECETVGQFITAGSYVECGNVGQFITAGSYVECEDVGNHVTAGSYVECENVGGQVTAGSYVECSDVGGNVRAGNNVECEDVEGSVSAEGTVECGDVHGNVTAGADVECGDVEGDVSAEGNVDCGDVHGSVNAGGVVDCDN